MLPTIEQIEALRAERSRILELIPQIEIQIRTAKTRQANAQTAAEQTRIDAAFHVARRNQRRVETRLSQIKDEIKTLNLRHQLELHERAEARRRTEVL